jgi:uncharacterized damage-inducible protein DinB
MAYTLDSTLLHIARTRLISDYPGQVNACLDVLTDEDIWWRPNPQSNAVGNLVMHLAGSNRYYLEQVIGGRDIGRNRDTEFAARDGGTRDQVRAVWNHAVRVCEEILNSLEPSQMMQETDRTGKQTTYAQILLHVTHHNAAHMGQIVWITKMRHAGALDELWMKMRTK